MGFAGEKVRRVRYPKMLYHSTSQKSKLYIIWQLIYTVQNDFNGLF